MVGKLFKPLGKRLAMAHILNDHPYKSVPMYKRPRENEIREKEKKKKANRRKNKK